MMSLFPMGILDGLSETSLPDFELGSVSMSGIESEIFAIEAKAGKTTKSPSAKGGKEAKAKGSKTKAPSSTPTRTPCKTLGVPCNFAFDICCTGLVCGLGDKCELEPEDPPAPPTPSSLSLSLSLP
jgi:hypothetical protein